MLQQLYAYLPKCDHYCEPFAGSATVLLNRDPSPIETLNDLNGDIVNFFQVLRDNPDELIYKLDLTPYSYTEFINAWFPSDNPVESARRFFIRTQMDISKGGIEYNKSWSTVVNYKRGSSPSAVLNFTKKVGGLFSVAERLKQVQIECRPAIKVIDKYDTPGTLFYCDPPYYTATRASKHDYKHEFRQADHEELATSLNSVIGRVALSGYDHPLYSELYPEGKWFKVLFKAKRVPMSGAGLVRQECLWLNYKPTIQTQLFS